MNGNAAWTPLLAHRPGLAPGPFEAYAAELARWNRSIRLVGPRDLPGIRVQIIDALLPFLLHPPSFPLLDIGSGPGLPAVPLSMTYRGQPITCLEPRAKRVSFLRHVVRTLQLEHIRIVPARAKEALARDPDLCGAFATATARAVADVPTLLDSALPFLKPTGVVYLPRGDEEPPSVTGWELIVDAPYAPPPTLGSRRLLVYRISSAGINEPCATS